MAKKEKPVLWGTDTTDSVQNHELDAYAWENFTPGWVPGYDEHVKACELEKNPLLSRAAKDKLYREMNARPERPPIRVTWVRVSAPDGGRSYNANVDLSTWRRRGYRPATVEILSAAGMQVPPTAHVEADGTIRREDVALWYVDEARARQNDLAQARFNADFHAMKPVDTGNPESPFIEVEEHESHRQKSLSELKET